MRTTPEDITAMYDQPDPDDNTPLPPTTRQQAAHIYDTAYYEMDMHDHDETSQVLIDLARVVKQLAGEVEHVTSDLAIATGNIESLTAYLTSKADE